MPCTNKKESYSQGDIKMFGANAGELCVPMSLCALIYYHIKGIIQSVDAMTCKKLWKRVINSILRCRWRGKVHSMQTELPSMIAMSEKIYQLIIIEKATQAVYITVIQ